MDGNGRWAQQRGLPRVAGHRAGAEALRRALQAAADHGVEVLTVYAFSSENWRRSAEEIAELTALMRFYLERELKTLAKEGVRLKLIGDYSAFGPDLVEQLERAVERTAENTRLTLGDRAELWLAHGNRGGCENARDEGRGRRDRAEPHRRAEHRRRAADPRPSRARPADPHVRRGAAVEFLLWQAAYAELLFLDTLWPDFDEQAFADALSQFAARQRRFGGRESAA